MAWLLTWFLEDAGLVVRRRRCEAELKVRVLDLVLGVRVRHVPDFAPIGEFGDELIGRCLHELRSRRDVACTSTPRGGQIVTRYAGPAEAFTLEK
jgi:hypothetical protein